MPRFKELFRSFRHFAFIIAVLFSRAGIFKANHSYLNPQNIGKFTLGDVLGTAAASIRYNRQSLPQTAIFLSVIGMISIITLQLVLTLAIYFTGDAEAASLPVNFTTPNPDTDLALNFLAHTFGAYDFLGVPLGVGPTALDRQVTTLHSGLHELLAFYNVMMMLVGAFIMGYYAVAAFLETALTGIPFGRRLSGYAAPLRAVIAFAILMPLPMPPNVVGVSVSGFNAAQYFVLFAARQGSGFASNLFNIYVAAIIDPTNARKYVATPTLPDVSTFVESMFNMMLCMKANDQSVDGQRTHMNRTPAQMAEFWRQSDAAPNGWASATVNNPGALLNNYRADLAGNDGGIGDLSIAAGPRDDPTLCGVIKMPGNQGADDAASTDDAWKIREAYLEAMNFFFYGPYPPTPNANQLADDITKLTMSSDNTDGDYGDITKIIAADRSTKDQWVNHIRNNILLPVFQASGSTISTGGDSQWRQKLEAAMGTRMQTDLGWAGAALFYNDIAAANLILLNAAKGVPGMDERPGPLDNYEATKKSVMSAMQDGAMTAIKDEMPKISEDGISLSSIWHISWGGISGALRQGWRKVKQNVLNTFSGAEAYEAELGETVGTGALWFKALPTGESGYRKPESIWGELGEVALRAVGLGSLADLQNDDPREVDPLATMMQLGSALQDSAVVVAIIGIVLGGVNRFGSASAGNFFIGISSMFWSMGTFLCNILPMIPFLYFFFGVVQWGFSVFEAVVAAPMFALTHIRFTSGDDRLIPQNAVQGYLMIFEIFLRPLMLVCGLIAAIVIFSGAASYLHKSFFVAAVEMLGQDNASGPIDTLAVIIVYIIQIYMLAMASFKLITIIPMGIMRWFGLGAAQSLDDIQREHDQDRDKWIKTLVGLGAARAVMSSNLPEQGPVAVQTADGQTMKLTVRPDGQMFTKLQDGSIARVKQLGKGEVFIVDPTARGGLRPVQFIMGGGGKNAWNSDAIEAARRRDELRALGRGVGKLFGFGGAKVQ